MKKQLILGIETSCDETSASILSKVGERIEILSNIVASSADLQSKYGGIIPEQAAREQIKAIIPAVEEALNQARVKPNDLHAIAVTQGPGLIGSLLVGVETAKALAWIWGKPIIPVNHLIGHFYANWISDRAESTPKFPCLGLLVSGGHTDLVLFTGHNKFKYLGGTRDDAAGECFDKSARLLGLSYPGGPQISKFAQKGNSASFKFPRPMMKSDDFDMSFSGLKTAVSNLVSNQPRTNLQLYDLCASIEAAIIDSLVIKVTKAAQTYQTEDIIVAGGVAANPKLRKELESSLPDKRILIPPPHLCTDNAAMIASAAFFNRQRIDPFKLEANPNLSLAY